MLAIATERPLMKSLLLLAFVIALVFGYLVTGITREIKQHELERQAIEQHHAVEVRP